MGNTNNAKTALTTMGNGNLSSFVLKDIASEDKPSEKLTVLVFVVKLTCLCIVDPHFVVVTVSISYRGFGLKSVGLPSLNHYFKFTQTINKYSPKWK